MFCSLNDLKTESDVEQKFVLPMLTTPLPIGLGYESKDFHTKPDIRKLMIDKSNARLHFPDYIIVLSGIPVFIIEVKRPGEDLMEALREARLYAHALNDAFRSGVNPCSRVIVTDGATTLSAPTDSSEPDIQLSFSEIDASTVAYDKFVKTVSRTAAQQLADSHRLHIHPAKFYRALNMIGGQSARDDDIGYNDFGPQLSTGFRHIFNPDSAKERAHIVRNAYVVSQRREHYVDEIDRIVAQSAATIPGTTLIEDTGNPQKLITVLGRLTKLENQVLLLVGGRGSGKTTFIEYFKEVKQTDKLRENTLWVHLNLNSVRGELKLLETWIVKELTIGLRNAHPEISFDTEEMTDRIFAVELNRFKKTALAKLTPGSEPYNVRLTDEIIKLQNDAPLTAKAMVRHLVGERSHRLLIVVFDNCDKLDRDEQLACFQAARWLQSEIKCLVFLPLRDVTYEMYKPDLFTLFS